MTAEEAEPLIEKVLDAMKPPKEPAPSEMGRGKRKRPAQSLAELGERAFKRLIRQGGACASEMPSGLRTITFLAGHAEPTRFA